MPKHKGGPPMSVEKAKDFKGTIKNYGDTYQNIK